MPSEEEMSFGVESLKRHENTVDYIISHCCPQHVASHLSHGFYKPDKLTSYFNDIADNTKFTKWFFGHYHNNINVSDKYELLYGNIVRVV